MTGLHISSFIDQHNASARAIARHGHLLADDWYSMNIQESALSMVAQGNGNWVYGGQYASGNCWWRSPDNKDGRIVDLH